MPPSAQDHLIPVASPLRAIGVLLLVVLLLGPISAEAASPAGRARAAVASEVLANFDTAEDVYVSCRRLTRKRYRCSWEAERRTGAEIDYFGRARVTLYRYGSAADLYSVRCHYCEDGPPPWYLR